MIEETTFKKTLYLILYAFLLYAVIDFLANSWYPEFRPYGLAILGAFVVYATYRIRKRGK